MPQLQAEDPDPLLSFSMESGEATALVPFPQPVAPAVNTPSVSTQSTQPELLVSRIEQLERALDDSRGQVASLQSQVKTLVAAVGDIGKPVNHPPAAPTTPPRRRASRPAFAIIGILIGVSAAIVGWMFVSSDGAVPIAVPIASATQQTVAAAGLPDAVKPLDAKPLDASTPIKAKPLVAAKPLEARRAPRLPKVPQALEATRYVGTLSIDAAPDGEVFLNRQSAGRTPLQLTNLRAGSHLIWIERAGYRRWTGVVQVPSDRVSRLSAELEPIAPR